MKFYHYTILFGILFLMIVIQTNHIVSAYGAAVESHSEIERNFYSAVDSAAKSLMVENSDGLISPDIDAAVSGFFQSMYASLGIMDNPQAKKDFLAYVPIIAVTLDDGYRVLFTGEYTASDGYTYYTKQWTELSPYSYNDDDFIYRFFLDGSITLYDRHGLVNGTDTVFETTWNELLTDAAYASLRSSRPDSFLFDADSYENVYKTAIITSVEESMRYYINSHNLIAQNTGIDYGFSMPVIDNAEWIRSIDNPSLVVMIQGYPISAGLNLYYSQFSVTGASISKDNMYFIEERDWYRVYHSYSCFRLYEFDADILNTPFYSEEECIRQGCYACPDCIWCGVTVPDTIYAPLIF